ncbi:hypothetical protein AWC38_SpisGene1218 [Stylophora pistillata]|uniref:Uncharacterized protein n=1 Tax=Stylophora pistillata TaxID=50429 RepID=A0A2B4SZA6_STYPI|nr:hypothetical protein AWC38_SpisGene1218 [Stylophora pistillata]
MFLVASRFCLRWLWNGYVVDNRITKSDVLLLTKEKIVSPASTQEYVAAILGMEKFKRNIQDEEKASRIDVEPASELEQALEDICALEESLPAEVMDSKQAKAKANKLKAEEIRQKAMESFGQTKAREGEEEPAKVKRREGNDSIQFLRVKSEKELEVRKQELKLKESKRSKSVYLNSNER